MSLSLDVPDSVQDALLVPEPERRARLLVELGCALYQREVLSFGKAAELANLSQLSFGLALTDRGIPRHYSDQDFAEDVNYARGQ